MSTSTIVAIAFGITVGILMIIGVIVSVTGDKQGAAPAAVVAEPQPVAAPAAYEYLKSVYAGTSKAGYLDVVTGVEEAGGQLTVRTTLGLEGREAAVSMCTVLSTHAPDAPVRVLDRSGAILVSRRGAGAACEWRR